MFLINVFLISAVGVGIAQCLQFLSSKLPVLKV